MSDIPRRARLHPAGKLDTGQGSFAVTVPGLFETAEDILNGRLIVEIHMAAVRPAEFIVLRFAHKIVSCGVEALKQTPSPSGADKAVS